MAYTKSIRFAGMGGQGIIFSGIVLANAFSLHEKRGGRELYAYETQSYGPEARGGASKCDVKVSDDESVYPFVEVPDYLVVMSQPAYDRYIGETTSETMVILDEGAVEVSTELEHYVIPASNRSEEMEARIVANVIMLGAFVEISGIISKSSVLVSLQEISPKGSKELNKKAFRLGAALGRRVKIESCKEMMDRGKQNG